MVLQNKKHRVEIIKEEGFTPYGQSRDCTPGRVRPIYSRVYLVSVRMCGIRTPLISRQRCEVTVWGGVIFS